MERVYRGAWGVAYLVYLIVIGLNMTATWFFLKSLALRLVGRQVPSHKDFVFALMSFLSPRLLSVDAAPTEEGCMVLANHVNWSDFVIDICLVPKGVYVSRNVLRYLFFPGSIFRDWLFTDVVFFKRNSPASKRQLYDAVTAKVNEGRHVVVYPEGTRNPTAKRLPLKLGLIKLAYDRGFPLYISMTSNKADICDEHRKLVTLGKTIENRKSDLIRPTDFSSFDDFRNDLQHHWDKLWDDLIQPTVSNNNNNKAD